MRVRWDRVGRVALLLLLGAVVLAYVGPARSLMSTWQDSNARQAEVQALDREHKALLERAKELRDSRAIEAEARRLGMVRPGERPYVVGGLPRD